MIFRAFAEKYYWGPDIVQNLTFPGQVRIYLGEMSQAGNRRSKSPTEARELAARIKAERVSEADALKRRLRMLWGL